MQQPCAAPLPDECVLVVRAIELHGGPRWAGARMRIMRSSSEACGHSGASCCMTHRACQLLTDAGSPC